MTAQRYAAAFLTFTLCLPAPASAQQGVFTVDANVALTSLVSIVDGHFKNMADALETLADTEEARSAQFSAVEAPLKRIAATQVPAALFFADRLGNYWTLDGKQQQSVADRAYFAAAMKGNVSIGTLVTSRSTGRPVAIIAVPITATNGTVVGLLGASIYLDDLSALVRRETGADANDLFWAIDPTGTIAIHSDPTNIFVVPGKLSPALKSVEEAMLARDEGTQTYVYRGRKRTVIFRKSELTGWRYGFGAVAQP